MHRPSAQRMHSSDGPDASGRYGLVATSMTFPQICQASQPDIGVASRRTDNLMLNDINSNMVTSNYDTCYVRFDRVESHRIPDFCLTFGICRHARPLARAPRLRPETRAANLRDTIPVLDRPNI